MSGLNPHDQQREQIHEEGIKDCLRDRKGHIVNNTRNSIALLCQANARLSPTVHEDPISGHVAQ